MESMDRSDWFIVAFIAGIFKINYVRFFKFIFKK